MRITVGSVILFRHAHLGSHGLQGLKECDCFLLVMSPRSARSPWVKREVDWVFHRGGKTIVPLLLEECNSDDFHLGLVSIQHVDFRQNREAGRKALLRIWVGTQPPEVRQPSTTPRQAVPPAANSRSERVQVRSQESMKRTLRRGQAGVWLMRGVSSLIIVVLLIVAVAAFWRGWFSMTREDGKFKVEVDAEKFKMDRTEFSKAVAEKAKSLKEKEASLWKKAEGLAGDEKTRAEIELGRLEKKHEQLEIQLKELEEAGPDKFPDIKWDIAKAVEEMEKMMEAVANRLEKGKDN